MNTISKFLAARHGKQLVANVDQPVTRAEFNALERAVALLIDDVETATAPGKFAAVINAAFAEATTNARPGTSPNLWAPPAPTREVGDIMPGRTARPVANAGKSAIRAPLALPADLSALAPKAD